MMSKFKRDIENYTYLKSKAIDAFREGKLEQALDYAYVAATYAWGIHLGVWYDSELEELLSKIAGRTKEKERDTSKWVKSNDQRKKERNVKSIAHIASSLSDVGGHSKVLKQWINLLKELVDNQILYITNTSNMPTKYSHLDNFKIEGIKIKQLSWNDSYTNRIKELIKLLKNDLPDIVILYIHPNDVIAATALLALSNKPYTIFFNHADHVFWLGRIVTDLLVEWRSESVKYSKMFRNINKVYIVPLTTDIKPKKVSKTVYGIPDDATLSVSIGSFYKVLGDPEWNYFEVIEKVLKRFPNHYHLFVTTLPDRDTLERYLPKDPDIRRRFIITGPFSNLQSVYGAAHFLIETFPCIGGMVRVEAMACGLPIVAIRNKRFSLLSETEALPPDYSFIATTEEEVVEYSSKLIKSPELRNQISLWLYRHYTQNFSPEIVRECFYNLINYLRDGTSNSPIEKIRSTNSFGKPSYNLEYVYLLSRTSKKPPLFNRSLFIQSIWKQSEFSWLHRFKFYITALKNKEFRSKKEVMGGIVLVVLGWHGDMLYKSLFLRKNRRV